MGAVLNLTANEKGRDFTVGDIHGCFDRLDAALEAVGFDPSVDRLISVGDLVNRGGQSLRCLEYLQQPWFFAVAGNHEDMVIENICDDGRLVFGDVEKRMHWLKPLDHATRLKIKQAFKALPTAIELQSDKGPIGFVHADIPPGMDWPTFRAKLEGGDQQAIKKAKWSRKRIKSKFNESVGGVSRVFFGHTKQTSGARRLGNCFYIDTGAVYGELKGSCCAGFMTVVNVHAPARKIAGRPIFKRPVRVVG